MRIHRRCDSVFEYAEGPCCSLSTSFEVNRGGRVEGECVEMQLRTAGGALSWTCDRVREARAGPRMSRSTERDSETGGHEGSL